MKIKKRSTGYILFISSAVILVWRGAWGLMDLYIFPDHELLSYVFSLVFGLVILLITHRLSDELI